jgi:hypothetical protein
MEKESLKKLLQDAIPVLCKSSLPLSTAFRIEAMIGVTVVDGTLACDARDDVYLICFKQNVNSDGTWNQQVFGESKLDEVVMKTPVRATECLSLRQKLEPAEASSPYSSAAVVSRSDPCTFPFEQINSIRRDSSVDIKFQSETITLDDDDDDEGDELYDGEDLYDNSIGPDYTGEVGYDDCENGQSYLTNHEEKPLSGDDLSFPESQCLKSSSHLPKRRLSSQLKLDPVKQQNFRRINSRGQRTTQGIRHAKTAATRKFLKRKRQPEQLYSDMSSVGGKPDADIEVKNII